MAVSPFSDGTPAASQWPIPPNHFFDYELETVIGMAGTYFYHSHIGFQAVTAAGPLIVEDATPIPYEYDEERLIALSDVFEKTDEQIESGLLANPFTWSGETANVLVNGKGHMAGTAVSSDCELASIDVEPDKTYRLRFIGGTALSFVTLAIEGHEQLTIIEADGSYTKPVSTSYLQIGSGQRFSVLLRTKSRRELSKEQFFMQIETRDRPTLTRSYAVLNYAGAENKVLSSPPEPPLTLSNTTLGWLDYKLESLMPDPDFPLSTEVTRRITIHTHQMITNSSTVWAQDNSPWLDTFPSEPYLVSLYKNDGLEFPSLERALANGGIDPVTRAFPADIGEVIEIVVQNTGSGRGSLEAHPFHAHGSHYYDLGSGNGTYDPIANEENLKGLQPVKRDTTMLYKYGEVTTPGIDMGWRAWRLKVSEPGVWMVHCHILQHMIMGTSLPSYILLPSNYGFSFLSFFFPSYCGKLMIMMGSRYANRMGDGQRVGDPDSAAGRGPGVSGVWG
jgi:L-ascorbate oxidase